MNVTNSERVVRKSGLYWLILAVLIIVLDQVVKYWVVTHLTFNVPVRLLPFLNLTLAHNKGAAFSFLSEGPYAIWLFIATAFVISLVLCVWLYRLPPRSYWLGVSLALILGGAIGNLLDRIMYGYVIDYIHVHIGSWGGNILNLADIAITVGAIMLIIDIFKKQK